MELRCARCRSGNRFIFPSGNLLSYVTVGIRKTRVSSVILAELETGRHRGLRDADFLQELVTTGLISVVTFNDAAAMHFERLVVGPAAMTLDDGEAATIACAVANRSVPIIDERKAKRICGEYYPSLPQACSTF